VSGAAPMRRPFCLGGVGQRLALGKIDAERLFRIGVLAGSERLQANGHMRLRDCQVDDDLDRRIGEQLVDAPGLHVELGRLGLRQLMIEIGHATDVEDRKRGHRLQIGARDIAASDDADTDFLHDFLPMDFVASVQSAGPVVFHGDS
jgi:hypothetical protein